MKPSCGNVVPRCIGMCAALVRHTKKERGPASYGNKSEMLALVYVGPLVTFTMFGLTR